MVALGCIPHNSKSRRIQNLLHLACRNGSVVPISVLGLEVGVRTPLISGSPGVFHAGTGRPRTLLAFFLWAGWVGVLLRHLPNGRVGVHFGFLLGPGGWASRFCRRKPGGRGWAPGHARPCRRSCANKRIDLTSKFIIATDEAKFKRALWLGIARAFLRMLIVFL